MKIHFLGSWGEFGGPEWFLGVYKWGPGGHWSNSGGAAGHQELKKFIFMPEKGVFEAVQGPPRHWRCQNRPKIDVFSIKIHFLGSWCEYGGRTWCLGVYKWGRGGHWSHSGANPTHQELRKLILMPKKMYFEHI